MVRAILRGIPFTPSPSQVHSSAEKHANTTSKLWKQERNRHVFSRCPVDAKRRNDGCYGVRNQGAQGDRNPPGNFSSSLEKMCWTYFTTVGQCLKILGPPQKTLPPSVPSWLHTWLLRRSKPYVCLYKHQYRPTHEIIS